MAVEEDDVIEVISTLQVTRAQPTATPRP
jgi:hypothetical protein